MTRTPYGRVVAAIVVTLSAVLLAGCGGSPSTDGPLRVPKEHGSSTAPLEVGQVFTDAYEILVVNGENPVTIKEVSLSGADPQMELVGTLIAGEERSENIVGDTVFPPKNFDLGPLTEAEGAILLPKSQQPAGSAGFTDYELILGIRVTEPGLWKRTGVRVLYEAGGREYLWESPAELVACTKEFSEDGRTCPFGSD